jgi:hypothetical protein
MGSWFSDASVDKLEYTENYERTRSINISLSVYPDQKSHAMTIVKDLCSRAVNLEKSLGGNGSINWVHVDECYVLARHLNISSY